MSGAATRPAVSVIVPMHQSEETVGETLHSLARQSFDDWEAIVVDDGSTDGGAGVIERIAQRERRVRMIRQENRGLAGARNTGIAAARGEFLLFLDADDWLPPRGLEWLHRAAAGSATGAAFGAHETCDAVGNPLAVVSLSPDGDARARVRLDHLLDYNRFPVHAQMIAARTLGGARFRERLRCVEDYDLWLRLAERGVEWEFVPEVVARYRLRPASMSRDFGLMWRTKREIMREAFERARSAGLASSVDLSDVRLGAFERSAALEAATAIAGSGRAGAVQRAIMTLRECGGDLRFSAGQAGETAHSTLPFAEGRATAAWVDGEAGRYSAAMRDFWDRCEREGIGTSGLARGAFGRIEEILNHIDALHDEVARRMARAARRAAHPTVMLGLGRNGRRVAWALGRAGVRFAARDDGVSPGVLELPSHELPMSSERLPLRVLNANDHWDRSAIYLMTVERDEAFLERLPAGLEVVRWSKVRDETLVALGAMFGPGANGGRLEAA